jgi:hypothetical protein
MCDRRLCPSAIGTLPPPPRVPRAGRPWPAALPGAQEAPPRARPSVSPTPLEAGFLRLPATIPLRFFAVRRSDDQCSGSDPRAAQMKAAVSVTGPFVPSLASALAEEVVSASTCRRVCHRAGLPEDLGRLRLGAFGLLHRKHWWKGSPPEREQPRRRPLCQSPKRTQGQFAPYTYKTCPLSCDAPSRGGGKKKTPPLLGPPPPPRLRLDAILRAVCRRSRWRTACSGNGRRAFPRRPRSPLRASRGWGSGWITDALASPRFPRVQLARWTSGVSKE